LREDQDPAAQRLFEKGGDMRIMSIEVGSNADDPELWKAATRYQLIYSICGLVFGLCCVLGGIALLIGGVTGATSWTAKFLGAESKISDAAPGVILFIVGLFVVYVTRFDVTAKARGGSQRPAPHHPKRDPADKKP
jgi:hypothetical protein